MSGRDVLKMAIGASPMGRGLNGALEVECCISYFGSQFWTETVHHAGEDTAASREDMGTDREQEAG